MSTAPAILDIHTPSSSFAIVHSFTQDTLQSLFDTLSRKAHTSYHGERVGPGWLKYEFNNSLDRSTSSPAPSTRSKKSQRTKAARTTHNGNEDEDEDDGIPKHKKEFEKFHGENGVRTVMGSIGPVQNVRMLLKAGYRHVYISRKFAIKHGFIPKDAAPGHYGYGGLVNIGTWPITLTPSSSFNSHPEATPEASAPSITLKPTNIGVFLAEEPHFDVVLGRSFFEKRQIRTSSIDPTDVVCLDTGEKVECELVILKDGRGEIVTVT
ncbi:hypothetical protein H0H87_004316 [Tephrocybe sp. NHM501043]|nr:hypothetical protein H0H87_004316 [Tephrocybe sp. NHM501043]